MSETISPNTTIAQYRVISKIGEGGMGEVYRARDTKLGRDVAIKVLPAAFSADSERLRRFEQEAQAAGALNHPNILVIFHIGTHDGAPYIVSELLEGETLRERMAGAALPQRKAMDYGLQIAHGLAAAHAKGIVHRDLKPENLFVTNDGRVKILDFGLAKLTGAADVQAQTDIPTRRIDTDPGVVMGTMGYMSPEQLRGKAADHRSDIFSFGAILYEMLSGKRAFRGASTADTITAILREDPPDLSETNKTISPALERVVQHCLEKNPEERFHSASDLAFAIQALSGSATVSAQTVAMAAQLARPRLGKYLPWIVAGVFALASIIMLPFAISSFRRTPARSNVIRAAILPPENANLTALNLFAVSPDGVRLAFVARGASGQAMLWVRPLDALTAQPLAGTDGVSTVLGSSPPFWSPDSRFIGFFAGGKLKKIDASGGPPQTICDAPNGRGGTWNREGVIVFAPNTSGPLHRVSAAGGASTAVTKLDESRRQTTHRWPYFLPDGHHFLCRIGGSSAQNENNGVYLGSLESQEQRLVLRADTSAAYASGHLLFAREGTLMAQPFDEKSFQLTGDAFPIAEHLQFDFGGARAIFSVSENGVLTFQSGIARGNTQLVWFDRSGKQIGQVSEPGFYGGPRLSADGQKLAVLIFDPQAGGTDIWLYELSRNVPTRFTFDPAFETFPLWSPDGSQVVFVSNRKGPYDIYQKPSSGAGSEEVLFESNEGKATTSWSPDGRFIAFVNTDTKANTKQDLWILPLFGDHKPFPFLQTPFNEFGAQFSPDGHWIAYVSDESGSNQVYIAPFPGPGGKWQVSRGGGTEPRWRGDGKELFFLASDAKLMAVDVSAKELTLEIGNAQPLFDAHVATSPGTHYDVTRDAKRFLIDVSTEGSSVPITLVVNWTADLKR
ncbi:MAG TPA: protein kinase [Pyrinomonadaceae bacterium]|nr:protein kinase [Pyrinomonadaceae bacterium]